MWKKNLRWERGQREEMPPVRGAGELGGGAHWPEVFGFGEKKIELREDRPRSWGGRGADYGVEASEAVKGAGRV